MNLYLIKIFSIFVVIICCLIATYTDVKHRVIPNKLTFMTLLLGIFLVSSYFYFSGEFRISYYLSIVGVFVFSYILWRIGVWAGGDVKLVTALSSLFIPEFLNVLPNFYLFGMVFPLDLVTFKIPIFFVIFNSVLSIVPVVLIYVLLNIFKDKPYLIKKLKECIKIKEVFLSLNTLIIAYAVISWLNIYHILIRVILLVVLCYIVSKIIKHDLILYLSTISVLVYHIITGNILNYISEFAVLLLIILIKNIHHERLIKEVLSEKVEVNKLEEGMILRYPLYLKNDKYYFYKRPWYNYKEEKGKLICSNNARGLNNNEIHLLKKVCKDSSIYIKKGMVFAPFLLVGLIVTFLFGNTYQLIVLMGGLI